VLGPLLFLAYVIYIGRNIESSIRLSLMTIIYKENINKENIEKLQKDVDRLVAWVA
jgi:hypothetical protein